MRRAPWLHNSQPQHNSILQFFHNHKREESLPEGMSSSVKTDNHHNHDYLLLHDSLAPECAAIGAIIGCVSGLIITAMLFAGLFSLPPNSNLSTLSPSAISLFFIFCATFIGTCIGMISGILTSRKI